MTRTADELIAAIDTRRIELSPEYDAGYVAVIWDDEEFPVAEGVGMTAIQAINNVLDVAESLI